MANPSNQLINIRDARRRGQLAFLTKAIPGNPSSSRVLSEKCLPDPLELEFELAKGVKCLFPTKGLLGFTEHFENLVSALRDGVPYDGRKSNSKIPSISEGQMLRLYLMSFIQDINAVKGLQNKSANGVLALLESAKCIEDETRTKKFLSAVRGAICKYSGSDQKIIEGIDAGCGSVPIQSIQAVLVDERVHVTAIEYNEASAEIARQIVESLGLASRINVVQGDATQFKPEDEIDFLISETLQAGLGGEPVAQILEHLSPYLKSNGQMIPEGAEVRCCFIPQSQIDYPSKKLKTEVSRTSITDPLILDTVEYDFKQLVQRVKFNVEIEPEEAGLIAVSIIVNLGSEVLEANESLITMPRPVIDFKKGPQARLRAQSGKLNKFFISYLPGGATGGLEMSAQ